MTPTEIRDFKYRLHLYSWCAWGRVAEWYVSRLTLVNMVPPARIDVQSRTDRKGEDVRKEPSTK